VHFAKRIDEFYLLASLGENLIKLRDQKSKGSVGEDKSRY